MTSSKKIVLKTKPYIINNKGFSTIEFKFIFPCMYNKEYMYYLPIMKNLLLSTSKKYNTKKKYNTAYQENFIVSISIRIIKFNKNLFLEFNFIVPDPKKVKSFNLNSAFEFFIETIYNPNVIDGKFDLKDFNIEKRLLKKRLKNSLRHHYLKSEQSFFNIVDDIGVLKDNEYNNLSLLEQINSKQLYNIYKNIILCNKPIIIVYGDVNKDINKLIEKYIKIEDKKIVIEKNYDNYLKPFKELKQIEELSDNHESIVYLGYKIKNMTEKDKIYLDIIKNILGNEPNDLIFKELRINKKLIYSSSVWMNYNFGLLTIIAAINNKSKNKAINSIQSVINKLKDKQMLLNCIEKLIKIEECNLIKNKDSRVKKLNDFITKKFEFYYTSDEILEILKNLDIDKLIDFLDRLVLDTIYFAKGDFNE